MLHNPSLQTSVVQNYCNTPLKHTCVFNVQGKKRLPMQLILKQISSHGNFRFAAQLLEIQSSSGLTSWLALLPNKAPIVWNL